MYKRQFHYSTADEKAPDYGILVNNGLVVMTQTVGDFKVTGDTSGYTYADNVLTIKDGANITITMKDGVDTTTTDKMCIRDRAGVLRDGQGGRRGHRGVGGQGGVAVGLAGHNRLRAALFQHNTVFRRYVEFLSFGINDIIFISDITAAAYCSSSKGITTFCAALCDYKAAGNLDITAAAAVAAADACAGATALKMCIRDRLGTVASAVRVGLP